MARRPLSFGARLRDKGRTVSVKRASGASNRYVVEDRRRGGSKQQRDHATLTDALRDLASTWRGRLN